jgi:hypothetical protein
MLKPVMTVSPRLLYRSETTLNKNETGICVEELVLRAYEAVYSTLSLPE